MRGCGKAIHRRTLREHRILHRAVSFPQVCRWKNSDEKCGGDGRKTGPGCPLNRRRRKEAFDAFVQFFGRSPACLLRGDRVNVSFRFADELRACRADPQVSFQRGGLGARRARPAHRAQRVLQNERRSSVASLGSEARGDLAQPVADAALDRAERGVEF